MWQQNWIGTLFIALLFAVLGSFFASVARDVIAIIERLRT